MLSAFSARIKLLTHVIFGSFCSHSPFSRFAIYGFIFDLFNVKRTYVLCTSAACTQQQQYSSKSMSILCAWTYILERVNWVCGCGCAMRTVSAKNKRNGRNDRRMRENWAMHSLEGDIGTISWDLLYCECTHSVFHSFLMCCVVRLCSFERIMLVLWCIA